jgi:antirestriction protein ArdC
MITGGFGGSGVTDVTVETRQLPVALLYDQQGRNQMSAKTDLVQQKLTEAVIHALTNEPETWTKPWQGISGTPRNPSSGSVYTGGNMMILSILSPDPSDPRWSTYKGWTKLGAQVRKGETGTAIIYWGRSFVSPSGQWKSKRPEHGDWTERRIMRGYNVFHASQVDDAPPPPEQPLVNENIDVQAHREWFQSIGSDWREQPSDRAFYNPQDDFIVTPLDTQFETPAGWFATVAHEHTHWTKPEARANRQKVKDGRDEYAFEELVAELGSVFLCNQHGIAADPRPDHAAYIGSWLKALKNDHAFVWDAASRASRAVKFLNEVAVVPEVVTV